MFFRVGRAVAHGLRYGPAAEGTFLAAGVEVSPGGAPCEKLRRTASVSVRRHDQALDADRKDLRIDAIAEQVLATDWATLGARILEAATIATAKQLAEDARRVAITGSVVEPPMRRVPRMC